MKSLIIIPDIESGSGTCVKIISEEMISMGLQSYILTRYTANLRGKAISYLKKKKKYNRFFLSLKRLLLYPVWPFFSFTEYKLILKESIKIVENEKIDVIIAVYNPIESLLVGAKLKKKYPELLFIPYFLDSLLAGQKPHFMPEWIKRRKALRIEKRILRNADSIIMMKAAEPVYNINKERIDYYDKIKFLDLPLYKPIINAENKKRIHFPKNQIVCMFAGSLPKNIRDPHYILKLFSQCDDIHFYIAGKGDFNDLLKKYATTCNNIHILGHIGQELVKEMYMEADFLVNIGNTLENMVPSKIFEYMSLGKPIISSIKIDDDPSRSYLTKYGNVVFIDERIDAEINTSKLFAFIRNARTELKPIKDFHLNRPSTFIDCIKKTYTNHV